MARITRFDLKPGETIADRYQVIELLGRGWESEVYLVNEKATGIERTAKIFIPERNRRNKVLRHTARKLHKLRHCGALVQYVSSDQFDFQNQKISMLISEFVEGALLLQFLKSLPGKRLHTFEALHFLHAMALALEPIHAQREYHGDLHPGNVLINRKGLGFDIRLIDVYRQDQHKTQSIKDDVWDIIRMFYDAMGGSRFYAGQPPQVKSICYGMRRSQIHHRFRHAGQLRLHLENLIWEE